MIHLFINALAASAGGGLTYIRNVVPLLSSRGDVRATLAVSPPLRAELGDWDNVTLLPADAPEGVIPRFWFEQRQLPGLIRHGGANVLLSVGNFALWNSPVPQILLSRNALYTSTDFERDLLQRRDYRLWIDTRAKAAIAKASIRRADATVAPSQSFADELHRWTGRNVAAIYHGFDREAFLADPAPLPEATEQQIAVDDGALRVLFVSHYNYYRNFETLLRAVPRLRDQLAPRKIRLILTCKLQSQANPGSYRANAAATLVEKLGISENVVELGSIPYRLLHRLYRRCDIYLTPAYAESFAHPLVEAMSTGIPVIAADIPVHREICGDAALYFDRFNPEQAANAVVRVAKTEVLSEQLAAAGLKRSHDFSWKDHIEAILSLGYRLLREPSQSR